MVHCSSTALSVYGVTASPTNIGVFVIFVSRGDFTQSRPILVYTEGDDSLFMKILQNSHSVLSDLLLDNII